jgi:hypothetical protein
MVMQKVQKMNSGPGISSCSLTRNSQVCEYLVELPGQTNGTVIISVALKKESLYKLPSVMEFFQQTVLRFGPLADMTKAKLQLAVSTKDNHIACKGTLIISAAYIRLTIPERIHRAIEHLSFGFNSFRYPMRNSGLFSSSNKTLNRIWEAAVHTVRLCILPNTETYPARELLSDERLQFINNWKGDKDSYVLFDGPRRDKEVWIGDLLPQIRTLWYAFGEANVIRNSLRIFADQQREDGFIPASAVSLLPFDEYCCWFFIVLYEYVLLSGDTAFLQEMIDTCRAALHWLENRLQGDILMNLPPMQTWAWTLSRQGCITSSQCVLHRAYETAALMESLLGCMPAAEILHNKAARLKKTINKLAWDDSARAYRNIADGSCPSYSLDANALAVLFGIAEGDRIHQSLDFIHKNLWSPFGSSLLFPPEKPNAKNWPHNLHIWPFAVQFEVDARFAQHDSKGAMDLLQRCWGTMLENGHGTFWEFIDGDTGKFCKRKMQNIEIDIDVWNSSCHGWSGGAAYSLQAYAAGITPLKPGFKQFAVQPQPSGMDFLKAEVPTMHGNISVYFSREHHTNIISIEAPKETEGTLIWGNRQYQVHEGPNDFVLT